MNHQAARDRLVKLRKEIDYHRYLYHVLDKSEISDAAVDSLKRELAELEREFPDLITADSPTRRVGGRPLAKFAKARHRAKMLSLADAFSFDELREWENRLARLDPRLARDFFAEVKVDGFAISLEYESGRLLRASTRGDGFTGENVTENVKTIESVPLVLAEPERMAREKEIEKILADFPNLRPAAARARSGFVEVRGEVYMAKKAFEAVNRDQKKKNLPLYANPRNIAAGSIRQLDPKIAAARKLEFLAYDLITTVGQETHEESHAIAKLLGFRTVGLAKRCGNLAEVGQFIEAVGHEREKLPFLIDGVVVQLNSRRDFERLGVAGKAPRGAIAFKFPAEEATTILRDIVVQVGRRGTLTPVAVLEPVAIGGVTVSRATLHNADEIERLGVKIGDTVIVERAGDVIPRVKGVLARLRPRRAKKFRMPSHCPVCGEKAVRQAGEVAYRCINPACPAVNRESAYHFVSRKAFDIAGLGPKTIDVLMDQGLMRDPADLFHLKEGDIAALERFGAKSAENIVRSIGAKKKITLARFIYALGIPHVGEETAADLAERFGSLAKLEEAERVELEKIPDVGSVVAASITDWLKNPMRRKFLERLKEAGIEPARERAHRAGKLSGKTFVLTGGLSALARDGAKTRIRALGGEVASAVSRQTDFVVAGSDPGSKYAAAKKLGIPIIGEKEFLRLIEES